MKRKTHSENIHSKQVCDKKECKDAQSEERGFILITVIVILAILTIVGAVSMMKSTVEVRVSAGSIQSAQALAAMNAGLNKTYADWDAASGSGSEFRKLTDWVGSKTGSAPAIYVNKYPTTLTNIGTTTALVDAWVSGNVPSASIYTLTNAGALTTGTAWGAGNNPQVAIWVTSFAVPTGTSDYPYVTPNLVTTTACPTCALVVYSLGRSGQTRRLGREYMSKTVRNIQAFGAMMNAPQYKTLTGRCTADPTAGSFWTSNLGAGSGHTHMIDSTQAPGGVAIASNNGVNISSNSKPYPNSTGTSLKGIDPYVVYDPGKVNQANYPKINGDYMSSVAAIAVRQNLGGTADEMKFFNSSNSQLFNLNAYREGANRIAGFNNETINGVAVDTSAHPSGLGNYDVVSMKTTGLSYTTAGGTTQNNFTAHRMGTLQWREVDYNIRNQIPMYGIVRILIPMDDNGLASGSCSSVRTFSLASWSWGDALPAGQLIVYGGALFDFFWDKNGNELYEPNLSGAAKERLLTPTEALLSNKLNVDTHIAFNPVMDGNVPRSSSGTTMDGVGVPGILEINTYPDGSPSWDLTSDKLTAGDGAMDIIDNIWNVGKNWSTQVYGAGLNFTNYTSGSWNLTANQLILLDYYIRTTANASKAVWSDKTAADIVTNKLTFKIETNSDTKANSASSADLFHTFLPSGYVHGWKRAMAVTGLAADPSAGTANDNETIWSEDLLPLASQFYADRHDFFFVTKNNATQKVYVDDKFADIPAEMYAGGLVDMHQHSNTSGVVYTPDQLELELKNIIAPAKQYINGIVITGAGVFMKDETGGVGRAIIAYDDTSIDNLPTNQATISVGRKYWQELQ